MVKYTVICAPIGSVVVVADDDGSRCSLRAIHMTGRDAEKARAWAAGKYPHGRHDARLLHAFQKQLRDYFAGKRVCFEVDPSIADMTEFQQRVLTACAELDYGQTVTYGELARRIGRPKASRAVGAALGRNPIPLVIPCHRVVGCNGSLGGFSAEQGIPVKRWLLDLETGRRRSRL
jgi:methylated-DNA-[protein]-cysteine S-methyltransferase